MAEKLCGIYKIVNTITGKIYIGLSKDIYSRWERHKAELRRGSHYNGHLQNAFNKYGLDSFEFDIVEFCTHEELPEKEKFYILEYNTLSPNGYNLTEGGDCPVRLPESIEKQSENQRITNAKPEVKEKRSRSGKKAWQDPVHRQAKLEGQKRYWESDKSSERRTKDHIRMKNLWADDEHRKKLEPHFEKMRAREYAIHKLADEQLLEVETKILIDKRSLLDIAKDYNVDEKTILNSIRRLENSRQAPGSIVPFKQKLDEDAIRFMLEHDGEYTAMQFSKMFGVGYRAIYDTLKGKNNVNLVNKVKSELNLKP